MREFISIRSSLKVREVRSSKAPCAWTILRSHTFKVAAGLLELLDITFIEDQDVALLVLVVVEVSASPSGWRDNGLGEASRQGGGSGRALLVSSC